MSATNDHEELVTTRVVDLMSSPVMEVHEGLCLGDALAAMVTAGLRHLVVVDAAGACRGVITDRAITSAWASDPTSLTRQPVASLLDRRPAVVDLDAVVRDVAHTMSTDRVDAVAIVNQHRRAVGIITGSDLVALIATSAGTGQLPGNARHEGPCSLP